MTIDGTDGRGITFWLSLAKDLGTSIAIVAVIAVAAYGISGTWPVMVAVESGSMLPNMQMGDVVFLQGPSRADIITYQEGEIMGYKSFGEYGDVIVYKPNGINESMPIIHRIIYWIDGGEPMPNGRSAPHSGYITKGDNNPYYDQDTRIQPIKPEWVIGVARHRVPYIGYARLAFPF